MNRLVKGLLTGAVSVVLMPLTLVFLNWCAGGIVSPAIAALVGAILGVLYGLEAGILSVYDLAAVKGWVQLVVDTTWSLPNTLFGFVIGNLVYPFFGSPSRADSENAGWIVFRSGRATGFGHDVLQTLGTVNLGGTGQHERMHLLQARVFGPLYLPLFGLNYVGTFLLQLLWTSTIGALLWKLGSRDKPYFRPPPQSAVAGFFGWIYYATFFELWAYASGNP